MRPASALLCLRSSNHLCGLLKYSKASHTLSASSFVGQSATVLTSVPVSFCSRTFQMRPLSSTIYFGIILNFPFSLVDLNYLNALDASWMDAWMDGAHPPVGQTSFGGVYLRGRGYFPKKNLKFNHTVSQAAPLLHPPIHPSTICKCSHRVRGLNWTSHRIGAGHFCPAPVWIRQPQAL